MARRLIAHFARAFWRLFWLRGVVTLGKAKVTTTLEGHGISSIPCNICGSEVNEFSIPNDIWNKVIRLGGHEHDQEYICLNCWYNALRIALGMAQRSR